MPTVQIDGVGRVELDDKFLELSPEEQDATIKQIIAQSQGSRTARNAPQPPVPAAPAAPEVSTVIDPNQSAIDAAGVGNMAEQNAPYLTDEALARLEEDYQRSLTQEGALALQEASANRPKAPGFFDAPKEGDWAKAAKLAAGQAIEGVLDVPGLILNPLGATINDLTGEELFARDVGAYWRDQLGFTERGDKYMEALGTGVFGGLGGAAGAKVASKVTEGLAKKVLADVGSTPIRDAVAGGSASLASTAAEDAGLGVGGQIAAGLVGGGLGYAAGGIPKAVSAEARATRFAKNEVAKNPLAAYQAEAVEDLVKARDAFVKATPGGIRGRAQITAKAVNAVETGYFSEYKNLINSLEGLSDTDKIRLKAVLTEKYAPKTAAEIDEFLGPLAGTVEGEAVKHAALKVNALRAMTPEMKGRPGIISRTSDVLDFIPGVPGIVPRTMRAVARASGDGEAARVNAADKAIARRRGYAKIAEMTGPSGARDSQKALWAKAQEAEAVREFEAQQAALEKEAERISKQANAAWSAKAKMEGLKPAKPEQVARQSDAAYTQRQKAEAAARKLQEEKMWEQYDGENAPVPVKRGQVSAEVQGWDSILRVADQRRKARLAADKAKYPKLSFEPPKPPKAAPAPKMDAVDRMVERGIQGEFRALDSLATSTGLSREDASRVLEAVAQDDPELAREVRRVVAGHNTTKRTMGPVLRPLMQAKMKELGITPQAADAAAPAPVPVDEAAQARLASKQPPAPRAAPVDEDAARADPANWWLPDFEREIAQQRRLIEGKADTDIVPPLYGDGVPEPVSAWKQRIAEKQAAVDAALGRAPKQPPREEVTIGPITDEDTGITYPATAPAAAMSQREMELTAKLDELDPPVVQFADDSVVRASEAGRLSPEETAQVQAIRDEIAKLREEGEQPQMRRVDRPVQWEQGRNRYQSQATDSINAMLGDASISRTTFESMGNAPQQIRDNFKTTQEAEAFIVNEVLPDLEADGVSSAELRKVRTYLFEVARAKPYRTPEDLERGTAYRGRGRPKD